MHCAVWIDNLLWLCKLLKFCVVKYSIHSAQYIAPYAVIGIVGRNSEAYSSAIDLEILKKKCLEFVRIEAIK